MCPGICCLGHIPPHMAWSVTYSRVGASIYLWYPHINDAVPLWLLVHVQILITIHLISSFWKCIYALSVLLHCMWICSYHMFCVFMFRLQIMCITTHTSEFEWYCRDSGISVIVHTLHNMCIISMCHNTCWYILYAISYLKQYGALASCILHILWIIHTPQYMHCASWYMYFGTCMLAYVPYNIHLGTCVLAHVSWNMLPGTYAPTYSLVCHIFQSGC